MKRNSLLLAIIGFVLWGWTAPETGSAHPLDPALLEIRESQGAGVEVLWKAPLAQPINVPLHPVLPDGCRELSPPTVSRAGPSVIQRWRIDCGSGGLVGERIGVEGLRERKTDALLRIHLADGRLIQGVLRGDSPFLAVSPRTGPLAVARDYLALGLEHILTGFDHLLFVLGLVLLVHGWRQLLATITAFTVGHSATLALAVLGLVHVPPAPVEALIAFSILVVAVELTRDAQKKETWARRFPWAMALAFGFLHGLGFAGALTEVGLPADEIPLALFSFNVGIELGQLLFVALALAASAALRSLPRVPWPRASGLIPAYAIGSLAAFWVFERVAAIVG